LISAQAVISRFRRDLTIGAVLRGSLMTAAMACIVVGPIAGTGFNGALVLIAVVILWAVLVSQSVKGSRLAADSPFLIASGRFDEAETRIDAALRSFSLFKTAKVLSLHHLAVLRHAQRHWQESALLCRTLLGQRLGSMRGLARPSSLLLADDLLHLGDLKGVYETLCRLYRQRLNLAEAMTLAQLQLEYLTRIGAFEPMLDQVKTKVQMAELMPPQQAARTQAFLALAAMKTGRIELSRWLKQRSELLCEAATLVAERPMLAELWPGAVSAEVASPGGR
jgi:hypothetical protein